MKLTAPLIFKKYLNYTVGNKVLELTKPIIFLILLFPNLSFGQPGGGGTITIHHIYDSSGNRIDVENDSLLSIKCYLLNDTAFLTKRVYSEIIPYTVQINSLDSKKFKALQFGGNLPFANYRLCILSEKDTMIIDFVNFIGENPIGLSVHIDSLVVQSVYFHYKKEDMYCIHEPFDDCWIISKTSNYKFNTLISDKRRSTRKYKKKWNRKLEKMMHLSKAKRH